MIELFNTWGPTYFLEYNKDVNVFVDTIGKVESNKKNIFVILEPFNKFFIDKINKNDFDFILTYFQEIIDSIPNARLFNPSNTWVHHYTFPTKEFSVSTLVGGKNIHNLSGYAKRHELWNRQNEIIIPKKFYLSSASKLNNINYSNQLVLYKYKEPLFDSQFHIVIENETMLNMWSEKIIDCFQTKTIPIYVGCKNIENFFNIDGIIKVESVSDIILACNELTPTFYKSKEKALKENLKISNNYLSFDKQLINKLNEIL